MFWNKWKSETACEAWERRDCCCLGYGKNGNGNEGLERRDKCCYHGYQKNIYLKDAKKNDKTIKIFQNVSQRFNISASLYFYFKINELIS